MIANISPSVSSFEDTYNTLKYANRAKNIKTQVTRNVLNVQQHVANYTNIINNLRLEINDLKNQLNNKKDNTHIGNIAMSNNLLVIEKIISDFKLHLDEELIFKKKIMSQEEEINNLKHYINIDTSNMHNNNLNTLFANNKNYETDELEELSVRNTPNNLDDKQERLSLLNKKWEINVQKLKEKTKKIVEISL